MGIVPQTADRVTEILREEALRRYSQPWPPKRRMESMGDFAEWLLEEGEAHARFYEKLRVAQIDERMADLRREHEARLADDEVARLCEAEVFPQ